MQSHHFMLLTSLLLAVAVSGCEAPADQDRQPASPSAEEDDAPSPDVDYRWMPDDDADKFLAIEGQMGGFSKTMRRVGYRYNELYWAGDDQNWDFATYQLEKLASEIERGIERRPNRATNARPFLDDDVPALQEVIDAEDEQAFQDQFDDFTQACNTCHGQEGVAFIQVEPLDQRRSPVRELSQ